MFIDVAKVPMKVLLNTQSEIECSLVRAELNEDIKKYRKFKDDLEEVNTEIKKRRELEDNK